MAISEHRAAIRLPDADYDTVDLLAERETEGNVSAMLRKLVREALTARGIVRPIERRDEPSAAEPF